MGMWGALRPVKQSQAIFGYLEDRMQQRAEGKPLYLWNVTPESMAAQTILTANHCLGCTAGAGSSCTGALESQKEAAYTSS